MKSPLHSRWRDPPCKSGEYTALSPFLIGFWLSFPTPASSPCWALKPACLHYNDQWTRNLPSWTMVDQSWVSCLSSLQPQAWDDHPPLWHTPISQRPSGDNSKGRSGWANLLWACVLSFCSALLCTKRLYVPAILPLGSLAVSANGGTGERSEGMKEARNQNGFHSLYLSPCSEFEVLVASFPPIVIQPWWWWQLSAVASLSLFSSSTT